MNRENGFLRADGSIKIEADFTVKTATLDHFLADFEDSDEDSFELDDDKNNVQYNIDSRGGQRLSANI